MLVACPLVLLAFAGPALADVTANGILERTHVDTANGPRPIDVLSTSTGPRVVTFPAGHPVPPDGAEVRLRGPVAADNTLDATSATVTGPSLAIPDASNVPLASGVARTVAIVVITFSTGVVPSYTDAQLRGVLTQNANSVSNYFSEQSYGQVSFQGITNPAGDIYRVSIASNGSGCSTNWPTWAARPTRPPAATPSSAPTTT